MIASDLTFTPESGAVISFSGDYAALSNFWPAHVRLDDTIYRTVEHAYQAAKTLNRTEREYIAAATHPGKAKRIGRTVTIRADWNDIKLDVMLGLLRQKFSPSLPYSHALKTLLGTNSRQLIEGNTWGDVFWGAVVIPSGKYHGRNHLGHLLMQVRKELQG